MSSAITETEIENKTQNRNLDATTKFAPFATVPTAPPDAILGLTEAFRHDPNPHKVNLGVGVYLDENGIVPVLPSVHEAQSRLLALEKTKTYLPIDGDGHYNHRVQSLLFGEESSVLKEGRAVTVQALGGTGALRVGADFLSRFAPEAKVYLSNPSWENHAQIFEAAGFEVERYPYYNAERNGTGNGLDFERMMSALETAPTGSIVVLHACCHNPTGVDLNAEQWEQVVSLFQTKALIPFLDFAYQGFAVGLEEDAYAVRFFANARIPYLIANSFSKSFSLYRERVGALTFVTESAEEAKRVLSQVKRDVRSNYSNPAAHGAQTVSIILGDPELRTVWESELTGMREHIRAMRVQFVAELQSRGVTQDFSFILNQRGMFSYSGLPKDAVLKLREKGIYIVDSGRICLGAVHESNIGAICTAIAEIL